MAIEESLEAILRARWGPDVRQAMHDAIHDCYEDGKAGAVDLVAREKIDELKVAVGTPLTASSAAGMTDRSKIYVYVGTTTAALTNGYWYYWDDTANSGAGAWVSGGPYNSTAFETDDTLSIAGAAADAKAVGDELHYHEIAITEDIIAPIPKTDASGNGLTFEWDGDFCHVSGTATANTFTNIYANTTELPRGVTPGRYMIVTNATNVQTQAYIWYANGTNKQIFNSRLSDIFEIPNDAVGFTVRLFVSNGVTVDETVRVRMFGGGIVDALSCVPINHYSANVLGSVVGSRDCDNVTDNSIIFVSSYSGASVFQHFPLSQGAGWLINLIIGSDGDFGRLQMAYPYDSTRDAPCYRTYNRGTWNDWRALGTGQSQSNDTYNNTYNITTTPTITTDTNGWLQPVDEDTESETNKTDMTGAIMSMLTETGYCHLAPGIFYVSGNIDLPEGATLEGSGKNTIIRLLSSVTSGYCVRVGRFNTVRNITFSGGYGEGSTEDVESADIGSRNGIIFIASRRGSEPAQPTVKPCVIENCNFQRFSGSAIYQHNTGGGINETVTVSDCYILHCCVGINIHYYSEYCKYTNIITFQCHYACINNGGNNVFVNCSFHGVIGFLIDNSAGDKYNNAHGSAIGCSFNHIDKWHRPEELGMGDGVVVKNSISGFIFSGCQLWYGEINIQNSRGITFANCLIGGGYPTITVSGNYPAFFNGCIFYTAPTIEDSAGSKFTACYHDATGAEINN